MNSTQHPSNNAVLGAPTGMKAQDCRPLAITRTDWNGVPAVLSFWRPTVEEIEALSKGALVVLWTLGNTTPPVAIEVETS